MSVNSTTPIKADQHSTYKHSSLSSYYDVKDSSSTTEDGIVLAKAKTDRDLAEKKRTEVVSLRKSRGDDPEFLEIMGSEIFLSNITLSITIIRVANAMNTDFFLYGRMHIIFFLGSCYLSFFHPIRRTRMNDWFH
ncbi:hypothetical protein EAF00_003233 [Botryotinia globosa]|nr:hypothetical protein EAF00_003233 [Botryotinia globosa]